MNMFLSGNVNIDNVKRATITPSYIRDSKESIVLWKGNTRPKIVIRCIILRTYLNILDPITVNIGVNITNSAIIYLLIDQIGLMTTLLPDMDTLYPNQWLDSPYGSVSLYTYSRGPFSCLMTEFSLALTKVAKGEIIVGQSTYLIG